MRLTLKQPWGVRVWSKHAAKIRLTKCFFDNLINMAKQCVFPFTYKKPILKMLSAKMESEFKIHLQTSRRLFDESFFQNILGRGYFFSSIIFTH